ncbi:hypothetical protein K4L06_13975 [Lysobacter sp. BMK333-48F3]|uniref:hypothetical protein n=1 Tax=Lysobacter sp. BMK333-48F3 TaxID=2867962 RepID=UPI001C8C47F1|nr:hypothetical protein [Lysobacter sp. BMK333-48F3]MBX9402419.1 hypothetical protein [Lysobacter sp. BMK333-48F3]
MKIRKMKGKALALLAIALMAAAGTVAAIPPRSTCTAENQGQRVKEYGANGTSRIYQCEDGVWLLYAICDYRGCVIVI